MSFEKKYLADDNFIIKTSGIIGVQKINGNFEYSLEVLYESQLHPGWVRYNYESKETGRNQMFEFLKGLLLGTDLT